jgi:hypothetical protein
MNQYKWAFPFLLFLFFPPIFYQALSSDISDTAASSGLERGPSYSLLSQEDDDFEKEEYRSGRYALSSGNTEPYWESYNQWLCFARDQINIIFVEVDYGGLKGVPTFVAHELNHRYEVSLSPELKFDPEQVVAEWNQLLKESSSICLYAAYLQLIDVHESLWTLSMLKTENGYWSERDLE